MALKSTINQKNKLNELKENMNYFQTDYCVLKNTINNFSNSKKPRISLNEYGFDYNFN